MDTLVRAGTRNRIFVSYSHADSRLQEALLKQLQVLEFEQFLEVWSDRDLKPGTDWLNRIRSAIGKCTVAVLLVSADFLTSNFIRSEEVPALLEKAQSDGLSILPVLGRACPWEEVAWLSQLQILPKGARPLMDMTKPQRETALAELARHIKETHCGSSDPITSDTRTDSRRGTPRSVYQQSEPIGRDRERDEALTILQAHRILLLYGAPGQGKTELARYVALSAEKSFADGVFEIPLQSEMQLDNVPKQISAALGDPEAADPLGVLASRRALVILDSFETLIRSSPSSRLKAFLDLLIDALSGDSRIIITSQERFEKLGVVGKLVRPLSREHAVSLFCQESGETADSADTIALGDFVEGVLGGHALSIKILARYSAKTRIDLETLSRLWQEKWKDIASFAPTLDDMALRTSFELSYSSLREEERLFFLALSALPDGIDSRYISAIWEEEEIAAYNALATLEERALLTSGQSGLLRMLGPIFRFAESKREEVEASAESPLATPLEKRIESIDSFYDSFVEQHAPQQQDLDPREKNRRISDHFHNIHSSLDRRLKPSTSSSSRAAAVSVLTLYWAYHNNLGGYRNALFSPDDAVEYFERARNIFEVHRDSREATRCSYCIGIILWLRGEIDKARPYLEDVLESESSPEEWRCDCRRAFAHMAYKAGRFVEAAKLYKEVSSLADSIGYTECWRKSQVGLLDVYRKTREYDNGTEVFRRLEPCLPDMHPSTRGNIIRGFAYILLLKGDFLEAEKQYKLALDIFSKVSAFGQAHCRRGLGDVYVATDRLEEARDQFEGALNLYEKARKNPSLGVGLVRLGLGRLALREEQPLDAIHQVSEAITLFDRQVLNEPFELAVAYDLMGDALKLSLKAPEALANYQLAAQHFEKIGSKVDAEAVEKKCRTLSAALEG